MYRISSILIVALVSLFAATAFAGGENLIVYAPKSSKLVMGANIAALKPSPLYKDMMAVIRSRDTFNEFLTFLETDGGLNIDRDIESIMVAMPDVSMNPNQAKTNDTISLAVRGKFDRAKLLAALNKRSPDHVVEGKGPTARHHVGEFTVAFITDTDLVMTIGDAEFQAKTWAAVSDKKASAAANKDISTISKKINLTRSLWLVGVTNSLPTNGAKMNVAGLTVDLISGLKIEIVATMNSKDDVKKSLEDFENLKKDVANPMVTMMGATPLLKNLKASAKGLDVNVTTSMSPSELQTMVENLKNAMVSGASPVAPPATKGSLENAKPVKGADADFN